MSTRATPLAQAARTAASRPRPTSSRPRLHPAPARTVVTVPHPDLAHGAGETRYLVRVFDRLPSMVHALAVVRAVEQRLGPVLSIDIAKDVDTLRPRSTIRVRLVRPAQLPGGAQPLALEIASPAAPGSDHLGGPALADVEAAVRSAPVARAELTPSPRGDAARPIQFTVEPYVLPDRARKPAFRRISPREEREDARIVDALRKFEGGFFGGFDGLVDHFAHLETPGVPVRDRRRTVDDGRTAAADAGNADDAAAAQAEAVEPYDEPIPSTSSPSVDGTALESHIAADAAPEHDTAATSAESAAPQLTRAERVRAQALEAARRQIEAERAAAEDAAARAARDAAGVAEAQVAPAGSVGEAEGTASPGARAAGEARGERDEAGPPGATRSAEAQKDEAGWFSSLFGRK